MADGRRNNGGARSGAGRKAKAQKYESQINAAEQRIADRLPKLIDNLLRLANGGWEEVEEEWAPAAMVTMGSGEFESRVFPDLPDEQLVRVKRKVRRAAPDRAANQYLIDRILGKPTARVEIDEDPDGTLEVSAQAMDKAAAELAEWRRQMTAQLSGLNVPLTPPTPATPTE